MGTRNAAWKWCIDHEKWRWYSLVSLVVSPLIVLVYTGAFFLDRKHGPGILEQKDGLRYEGEWEFNLFHGKGKLTLPTGLVYAGDFKEGLMHGTGFLKYPSGAIYSGQFSEDLVFSLCACLIPSHLIAAWTWYLH